MKPRSIPTFHPFLKPAAFCSKSKGSLIDVLELVPSYDSTGVRDKYLFEGVRSFDFHKIAAAIESENLVMVKRILQNEVEDLQLSDSYTQTNILHIAAKHPNQYLWTLLVLHTSFEIMMNQKDERGTTPLIAATFYNNMIAVKILLDKGANTEGSIVDTNKNALHVSAELQSDAICKLILENNKRKEFINQVDWEGNTPLMLAVIAGTPNWKILLAEGADFKCINHYNRRNVLHLAAIHNNYEVTLFFISNLSETTFFNLRDMNSHTPLHLALLTSEKMLVGAFMEAFYVSVLLQTFQNSLHLLVVENKKDTFDLLNLYHSEPKYYDVYDEKGRTLLMHAVELLRKQIVKILIITGVNFKTTNYITGETVLHAAVYSNDVEILDLILGISGIEQIVDVADYTGTIPYEVVLRTSGYRIFSRFVQRGLVSRHFQNKLRESALFIAAKEGNYILLLTLLLSMRLLMHLEETEGSLSEEDLLKMERKGILYPSDIYICLGNKFDLERSYATSPRQGFLFQLNSIGQNIFHACALSESLECIVFMYNYCNKFNVRNVSIHQPDDFGNTPLLLAIHGGNVEVAKFLLTKGCNITHKNKFGWKPLLEIGADDSLREMYYNAINDVVYLDYSEKKSGELTLNFRVLCPTDSPQMTVVNEIFKTVKGPENYKILNNHIIEYFVVYKWIKIRRIIAARLLMNGIMAAVFSTYLTFKICEFLYIHDYILHSMRWATVILSISIIFFNAAVAVVKENLLMVLVNLLGPVTSLIYLFTENQESRSMLEIGAVSILVTWICVLFQGHVTNLSFQIAMFLSVLKAIIKYLPICVLVVIGFSMCFFTLFHDYLPYNNPLRAFITTCIFLREGETEFPMFSSSNKITPFHNGEAVFESPDPQYGHLKGSKELRNILVEGFLVLVFEVFIGISVFNMLIGLAVRSGEEIENEGKIHKIKRYSEILSHWENFVNTPVFRFFRNWKLLWLIGLPSDLEQKLTIPIEIKPLQVPLEEFDLHNLKVHTVRIPYKNTVRDLYDLIQEEERASKLSKTMLRRGSRAATNWAFLLKKYT